MAQQMNISSPLLAFLSNVNRISFLRGVVITLYRLNNSYMVRVLGIDPFVDQTLVFKERRANHRVEPDTKSIKVT